MTEVNFRVTGASAVPYAASPELALAVEVSATDDGVIDSVLLRSAVRIEAGKRAHDEKERERLRELFGGEGLWARSTKSLLWARTTSLVSGFRGRTIVDVHLPCSFDLAAAASRYLHAVEGGDIPVTAQFSGTLFYREGGALQVSQIPWDREAPFRIPCELFQQVIDAHFPDAAVFGLRRDLFERLDGYRRERGLSSPGEAIERLLSAATGEGAR